MDHAARLRRLMSSREQPLLVTSLVNIRYLTGFTGSAAKLLVTGDGCRFLTDGRYAEVAASVVAALPATELTVSTSGLEEPLREAIAGAGAVELEADHVSWAFVRRLAASADATLAPGTGVVEELRRVKDADEVAALRAAADAGDAAFVIVGDLAAAATTEGELGRALVEAMRDAGAEPAGWPPIVAAGSHAARPHHRAGDGRLGDGLLLVDYGCTVAGYHSDMTRTLWCGAGAPDAELSRIHAAVREANEAGIAAVRPGVPARDVDAACRTVLRRHGLEEHFLHSTGHGIGLEIHEAPWLRRTSDDVLAPGHVVTVEPGVYLPEQGGVRIEDMVLVTERGHEVLTRSTKELTPT